MSFQRPQLYLFQKHPVYENLFYKVTSDTKLKLLIHSISNKTDIVNGNFSESNPQVKLPNIQLPSFSGSFTEWITFRKN
jgi:hypothetical protein